MNNRKNDPKSLGMFLASMVIFGSVGLFRRNLPLSSAFLAFSRGLLGGGFVLAFMLLKKTRRRAAVPPRVPVAGPFRRLHRDQLDPPV